MTAPDSPVRYFIPVSKLPRGLRGKLQERVIELEGFVIAGAAIDFADYRYRVGQIEGMNQAIAIFEQMEKDENK